ncbi:hypothetical protein F5X98DRAFT_379588 [Xylaria grammica]|nr:hypothetical protein F5X98DRAFT_379588 [Xylaria grammica]
MSDTCSVVLWARIVGIDARETGVECRWATSQNTSSQSSPGTPTQTIDVVFSLKPDTPRPSGVDISGPCAVSLQTEQDDSRVLTAETLGQDAFEFLHECLHATIGTGTATARFVIPLQKGTIIMSDIVSFRLHDAFWVDKAASFASPLQIFPGSLLHPETASLATIFRASAGAALLKPSANSAPANIERDFSDKLSIPWISAEPISRKRLVLVGSSNQDPAGGGWTQFARRAAVALGIDLVFIDRADGWLARGDYGSWYEALIPAPASWWAEPSADELVALVEGYQAAHPGQEIAGLATFIEALQVPVSTAAARLGLPHELPSAFERATNKYKLGLFQNRPAFLASSAADVARLVAAPENQLAFPLIVKPSFGLNSEGVTRVDGAAELEDAILAARRSGRSKSDVGERVLVERYCEGPEVDVNMVFVDGEVVFYEICDDFPKGADLIADGDTDAKATAAPDRRNFQETNMVFPSALPDDELAGLRDAVENTLRGLGFRNGVMHVEARVAHSKHEYGVTDGVVDLRPRDATAAAGQGQDPIPIQGTAGTAPMPWIIEVNPRPPGLFASQTPSAVYGVDYWGISLLLRVGDGGRAGALSAGFAGGAQSHTVLVMIRAEFDDAREGVFDSEDVCAELLARRPELRAHLGRYGCLLKKGEKIPHPSTGRNTFVAYLNVFSRTSRREALLLAQKVREEIRYEIR